MKRIPSLVPCLVLLILLTCLVVAGGLALIYTTFSQAEARFGPPAAGLEASQHLYLSRRLLDQADHLTRPANPHGQSQVFQIQVGEDVTSITTRLEQEGLILDAQALRDYLIYSGKDRTIQAGTHRLDPAQTALQIVQALQDPTPAEVSFSVLPGWRLEEIAASLPTSGLSFSAPLFLEQASHHPTWNGEDLPDHATYEGFLLPGTYQIARDLTPQALMTHLFTGFQEQVTPEIRTGFSRQGLTLYQAVTLASLVQREAMLEEEMPMIASVFYNRLNSGMRLDSDPTVQYALGFNPDQTTWWTNPLSAEDLKIQSPFNTYQITGLPPSPICNPGLQALRAVAFPAQTPYYFFRADCTQRSRHAFSTTLEEHIQHSCP